MRENDPTLPRYGTDLIQGPSQTFEAKPRSNPFEDKSVIELITNSNGEIRQYKHLLGPHVFRIDFDPALPTIKSARSDQKVKYSISLDNFTSLVQGLVSVKKQDETVQLNWQHDAPAWTRNYHFTSVIRPAADGGYDLEVARATPR